MSSFSLSMDSILKNYNGNVENIVKKSVIDLTSAIIKDTAIDSGRLRANWQVSFNQPLESELDNKDISKDGKNTALKNKRLIADTKVPLVYWITNNLPYASKIEYGASKQNNGMGMVRVNILRFNKFLKDNTK